MCLLLCIWAQAQQQLRDERKQPTPPSIERAREGGWWRICLPIARYGYGGGSTALRALGSVHRTATCAGLAAQAMSAYALNPCRTRWVMDADPPYRFAYQQPAAYPVTPYQHPPQPIQPRSP
jgi:uncharacterized protein (DUF1684 family)